jgi:hypothetical protein
LASNASKLGIVTTDNAALTKGRSSTTIQAWRPQKAASINEKLNPKYYV